MQIVGGDGHGFLVEEKDESLPAFGPVIWVIDPIDGTGNYQRGIDLWGIAISLWEGNKTVYAAILYPTLLNKMYYGFFGKGVYDAKGNNVKLHKMGTNKLVHAICGIDKTLWRKIEKADLAKLEDEQSSFVDNIALNLARAGSKDIKLVRGKPVFEKPLPTDKKELESFLEKSIQRSAIVLRGQQQRVRERAFAIEAPSRLSEFLTDPTKAAISAAEKTKRGKEKTLTPEEADQKIQIEADFAKSYINDYLVPRFDESRSMDDLEQLIPDSDRTIAERLRFLMWHETYHVGQTEYLRQLAGKGDKVI